MSENTQKKENTTHSTIRELPVLPGKELVLFPHMVVSWVVEQPNLVKLVDDALATDRTVAVLSEKKTDDKSLGFHNIGTVGLILRMAKNEEGHARLIVQGVTRVRLLEITEEEPYIKAKVEPVQHIDSHDLEIQALAVNARQIFTKVLDLSPNLPRELGAMIMGVEDSGALADIVISHLNISTDDKQTVLEALDVKERLQAALRILTGQLEILELGHKIQSQVKGQVEKTQKEFLLREQLKAIKKELGEGEEKPDEIEELR
ncbi:MAG: LON peptidase substrate-binding domain-containing protein, partial [Thermodesulfobacteriota bacterium]|nr:LON peptidase substrate-binding domain-containing protein [Thermodesulfobacteriota bacterium]